jgi:hypothetical protein
MSLQDWQHLIAQPVSDGALESTLRRLLNVDDLPQPDIKAYSDVVYYNYYSLGVSLCLVAERRGGTKITDGVKLIVDSVDLYNPQSPSVQVTSRASSKPTFSVLSALPLSLSASTPLTTITTGRDFVQTFGEPSKKGGGTGWVDIWLEWEDSGIQVELRDPKGDEVITEEAKKKGLGGPWDRAGSWVWGVIKLFSPTEKG